MHLTKTKITIIAVSVAIVQSVYGQWERTNFPLLKYNPSLKIYPFEMGLYANNFTSFYKSTDNGINWSLVSNFNFDGISDIVEIGNTFIATTSIGVIWPETTARVFRSTNAGQTWDSIFKGVYGAPSIERYNSKLLMNLDGFLFLSVDTGKNWTKINTSSYFTGRISEIIVSGNSIYTRIQAEQLFRSDDEGLTWTLILSKNLASHFFPVVVRDSTIFVGTYNAGCLKSTNKGSTWNTLNHGLPDSSGFRSLLFCGDYIIGSVSENFYQSVYKIKVNDTIWQQFNDGLNLGRTAYIHDFEYNNNYIFLASDSSIWRRPISELITSVNRKNNTSMPDAFNLQNYPNPFNSSTTISFNIKSNTNIKLVVFDILGRKVKTIYEGEIQSGNKHFNWNATALSSGVYIGQLSSHNKFETVKIILDK